MSTHRWVCSTFTVVLLSLVSFRTVERAYTHPTATRICQDTVVVTDADSGKRIGTARGNILIVRLEGQPGTGYGWQIVRNDTIKLKPLGEPVLEAGQGLAGGVEHQLFSFKAQRAGTIVLELQYVRPWEKDVPPAKTYQIKVKIRQVRSSTTKPCH